MAHSSSTTIFFGIFCLLLSRAAATDGFFNDGKHGNNAAIDSSRDCVNSPIVVTTSAELNNALANFEADNFDDENKEDLKLREKDPTTPCTLHITLQGGDYDLDREFFVTRGELHLLGEGNVVIRAAANHRHFTIEKDGSVLFEHISLVDGGNNRRKFLGGSIRFHGGDGLFRDVTFRNNRAFAGGAVFIGQANRVEFDDSIFENNRAERDGGAVFIGGKRFIKSVFGHDLFSKTAVVIFNFARFEQNEAHKGGALWTAADRVEVNHSTFFRNKADVGGAIYNRGRLLVRESTFEENEGRQRAGAIFNCGKLVIVCSTFINNRSPFGRDIVNNGKFRCSAISSVDVVGKKDGFCASCAPTAAPTRRPTRQPTPAPSTARPTQRPTTPSPTKAPVAPFTERPTVAPTERPTRQPTLSPTRKVRRFKKKENKKATFAEEWALGLQAQQEEKLRKEEEQAAHNRARFVEQEEAARKGKKLGEKENVEEDEDLDSYLGRGRNHFANFNKGKKEEGRKDNNGYY